MQALIKDPVIEKLCVFSEFFLKPISFIFSKKYGYRKSIVFITRNNGISFCTCCTLYNLKKIWNEILASYVTKKKNREKTIFYIRFQLTIYEGIPQRKIGNR